MKGEVAFQKPDKDINAEIPQPLNWKILVRPLESKTHSDAGIEYTEKTQRDQEFITNVGQVVAMGELAYLSAKIADSNNPKIGDWVLYPTYGGTRVELADGRVFQLMSDDHVTAVVTDPEMYRKKLV